MIKADTIFKYRIRLSKTANAMRHHDFKKMIRQAVALAGFDFARNKTGPRVSYGPGTDEASLCEFADIFLRKALAVEEIKQKLSPFIEGGYSIEEIKEVPRGLCSVEVLAPYALYEIKGISAGEFRNILNSDKVEFEIAHNNGMREVVDIKPFILSLEEVNSEEVKIKIKISVLRSAGLGQILLALPGLEVNERKLFIRRVSLLWQDSSGKFNVL